MFRDLVAGLRDLGHDEGTVAALVAKHLPMRMLLSRTGQLMRASRMLSDDEISELCVKCEKSGADLRVVFTDKHQTPKGRWLERHVWSRGVGVRRVEVVGIELCDCAQGHQGGTEKLASEESA